jgi:hypothetical protein
VELRAPALTRISTGERGENLTPGYHEIPL